MSAEDVSVNITEDQVKEGAAYLINRRGYIVIATQRDYQIGQFTELSSNVAGVDDCPHPINIIGLTTLGDFLEQVEILERKFAWMPKTAIVNEDKYYRVSTD